MVKWCSAVLNFEGIDIGKRVNFNQDYSEIENICGTNQNVTCVKGTIGKIVRITGKYDSCALVKIQGQRKLIRLLASSIDNNNIEVI